MKLSNPSLIQAALLIASCVVSNATTFTYNQTVTLNPSLIQTQGADQAYFQSFSNTTAFNVKAGDTLTGTITFANGPVTIRSAAGNFTDFATVDFFFNPDAFNQNSTGTVVFQGLTVAPGTAPPTVPNGSSGSLAGPGASPDGLAHNFSFTGMTYTINFTSVTNASNQPATASISFAELFFQGDQLSIGSSATPEPASAVLCATGCSLLAWMRRRRRPV